MNIIKELVKIFFETITKRIFVFKGRSSRKEYVIFYIFGILSIVFISLLVAPILISLLEESKYNNIFFSSLKVYIVIQFIIFIVYILASISLTVRRLHDLNFSGWWILLTLVIPFLPFLTFVFMKGTKGPNKYGEAPNK
jgi:uncharacterized membrane protein YhaH (DUF805 family)